MDKFQVSIFFSMDEHFMSFVPEHRKYINSLIEKNIIEHYAVSMDSFRSWILINAKNKEEVQGILEKSPLFKYWIFEIDKLFVYDGASYRLPEILLN
ncbi:MAG: hypothetical protein IPI46_05020 [Bacteroidetes bacterium]|nr:hypothetical protein [Bacteroidota bacterium]